MKAHSVVADTPPSRMRHAVIAGSLGKGNAGDDAILQAFLDEHGGDYASVVVLTHDPRPSQVPSITELRAPHIAVGMRFWRGQRERNAVRHQISVNTGNAPVDYVWIGGLLGRIAAHVHARTQELRWARSFADRFVYYFGDAEEELADVGAAKRLVDIVNRGEAWIAVRSQEAGEVLERVGVRPTIAVGVDPALYSRAKSRGLPFRPPQSETKVLTIIPCGPFAAAFREAWVSAARTAQDRAHHVEWVSMCDPVDLDICRSLQHECHGDVVESAGAERALANAACVVATRYHGAIFGLCAGIPTIMVPYSAKMRRLAALLNLDRWVIDSHADSAHVRSVVESVLAGEWHMDADALARSVETHSETVRHFRDTLTA